MRMACASGATILPASSGVYAPAQAVSDPVDFIVAEIPDRSEIEHNLIIRWGSE